MSWLRCKEENCRKLEGYRCRFLYRKNLSKCASCIATEFSPTPFRVLKSASSSVTFCICRKSKWRGAFGWVLLYVCCLYFMFIMFPPARCCCFILVSLLVSSRLQEKGMLLDSELTC